MAGDGENDSYDSLKSGEVALESGLPQVKKIFWQAKRRRFLYFALILLIPLVGAAALGAALVATGVLTIFGVGALAITAGAVIGIAALTLVAALFYGAYKLFSFLFSNKPAEPKEEVEQFINKHDPEHDLSEDDDLGSKDSKALSASNEDEFTKAADEGLRTEPPNDLSSDDSPATTNGAVTSDDEFELDELSSHIDHSNSGSSSSPRSSDGESPTRTDLPFHLLDHLHHTNSVHHFPFSAITEEGQELKKSFAVFATENCSEQIVKTVTGENRQDFSRYSQEDLTEIKLATSTRDLFAQIEQRMRILEQLKHPEPLWSYSRLEPSKPGEKVIIKIEHNEGYELNSQMIADKKRYSLATRKLSVIGGVLSLLDCPAFLTEDMAKKQAIKEYLTELSNQVLEDAKKGKGLRDVNKNMNHFVAKLNQNITKIVDIKDEKAVREHIIGPIREAERYFVAEHNQNHVLAVITNRQDGSKIIQIDNSFNHELTKEQKAEYMKIHGPDNQPSWFTNLHPAEQAWYLARIPQTLDAPAWTNFEILFKSSAMQHTPGLVNARVNYLITQSHSSLQVQSVSLKSGTPVTYEMQQSDCKDQAILNIKQEVKQLQKLADYNFQRVWGKFFEDNELKKPPRLILIQSLLSSSGKFSKADEDLIEAQRLAVEQVQRSVEPSSDTILYHNNATNSFRLVEGKEAEKRADIDLNNLHAIGKDFLRNVIGVSRRPEDFSEDAENALKALFDGSKVISANEMIAITGLIEGLDLTEPQKLNLHILVNVENQFRKVNNTSTKMLGPDRRNQEEYIIALKKMYIEAMGGATINNCKSGKDRTGQSEVYQHAICLETKELNGQVIAYDETGDNRKQFCSTAALLNCSMKIQEAAAFNTPGSVGTKAPKIADIVDSQIVDNMKRPFAIGCELAGLNKCKVHQDDENHKMHAIKKWDKINNKEDIEANDETMSDQ